MQVQFWAATDVGLTRDHNEDNYLVDRKLKLFVVADGMGGHAAGEIASSVAVHEVRKILMNQREVIDRYASSGSVLQRQTVLTLIDNAISSACQLVYQLAQENSERHGMGTTLSLLLLVRNRAFIGHVGDSRIYRLRRTEVSLVTEDHSVINELIKSGRIKPGDAFNSPYKNAVTRAVGVHPNVEVDTFDFEVKSGDNYLLCSDGLSCYLDDPLTSQFLSIEDVKEIPQALIDHANHCGGKDNITAVVIRTLEVEGATTKFGIGPPPLNHTEQSSDLDFSEVSLSEDQGLFSDDAETDQLPPPIPSSLPSNTPLPQSAEPLLADLPLDLLKASPLFALFGDETIDAFCREAQHIELEQDAVLFLQEDGDRQLYFILSGELRLERDDQLVGTLSVGETWGEEGLLSPSPRQVTVIAEANTQLLAWPIVTLHDVMAQQPEIASRITWGLASLYYQRAQRLQNAVNMMEEVVEVTLSSVTQGNSPTWREQTKQIMQNVPISLHVHTPITQLPAFVQSLPETSTPTFNLSTEEAEKAFAQEINVLASSQSQKG